MIQSVLTAVTLTALAALPPTYGSELTVYVYGSNLNADPAQAKTIADASAQSAVFERLYAPDRHGQHGLRPILASGAPVVDGPRVLIPLRRGIRLHDGEPLTPYRVIEAFERLTPSVPGAYVMAPVLRRGLRPAIAADDERFAVQFELTYPDPDFPHLLAADHARLSWPDASGMLLGTGPFRWSNAGVVRPFLGHRDGRPYLDRIAWRPYASRFGANALVQRGKAPVMGAPEPARALAGSGSWLVLQVGDGAGDAAIQERIRAHLQSVLRRPLIVRRYLGPHDRPAEGFINKPKDDPGADVRGVRQLELLAPRGLRFGHRLVERIQLELYRHGLGVEVKWLEADAFPDSPSRSFDLRLFEIRPGVVDDGSVRAQLHRTLSAAATLGVLPQVSEKALARFAAGNDNDRRRELIAVERQVRLTSGVVVIGRMVPAVAIPSHWPPPTHEIVDWANLRPEASP